MLLSLWCIAIATSYSYEKHSGAKLISISNAHSGIVLLQLHQGLALFQKPWKVLLNLYEILCGRVH